LDTSLSVLLPVYNAEDRLGNHVGRILDVLPELTRRFEVVIIDDGSLDETAEAAYKLARCYPQVNVVRHPFRLGLTEAIQSGLDSSGGEIVFVGDEQHGLDPQDLRKLWRMQESCVSQDPRDQTGPAAAAVSRTAWVDRLLNWRPLGRAGGPRLAGIQIIQRGSADEVQSLRSSTFHSTLRLDQPAATRPQHPSPRGKPKRRA